MHTSSPQPFYAFKLTTICFLPCVLVSLFSCHTPPTERYGFLTLLGKDTISVESITQRGNELTSDEVDRFPRVHIRHTVVTPNDNGSIRHLVMDIHTPSEPAGKRYRKVVADVTNHKVHLSKTISTGKSFFYKKLFQARGLLFKY